ncbi:MAG: hypothetical protein IIA91_10410 [Chloroflexi bacterium]|nr:hypothetical protein [Chloroflexota bacterium]
MIVAPTALGVIAALALAACNGDSSVSPASPGPSPELTEVVSPVPTPTSTPLSTPVPQQGTPGASGCPSGRERDLGLISNLEFGDGLSEYVIGEPVSMTLTLTNCADNPARLFYPDGQRYEFIAEDEQGQEVWRWSFEKAFTQAVGEETIGPGETVAYSEVWEQSSNDGQQVDPKRYKIFGFSVGCGVESAIDTGCHFGVGLFISIEPGAP